MGRLDLKRAVSTLARARTRLQPFKNASMHRRSVQPQPESVRGYFHHEQVCFAT